MIYVPNAFTPNKDGLNDLLKPFMIGIRELKYFRIFNRWGQLVFETQDPNNGWDGRIKAFQFKRIPCMDAGRNWRR